MFTAVSRTLEARNPIPICMICAGVTSFSSVVGCSIIEVVFMLKEKKGYTALKHDGG
jgi:hypothetical protein